MNDDSLFKPWPKIERMTNLDMVVTEKIDGTNACVAFHEDGSFHAQSRNRIIEPGSDNQGFAAWAHERQAELLRLLGVGYHYGEWWGRKIGRTYDREDRTFSLFNVGRWNQPYQSSDEWRGIADDIALDVVPLIYHGPFDATKVQSVFDRLQLFGSIAAPGFAKPEGICVYLPRIKTYMKVTDAMAPKGPKANPHDDLPPIIMPNIIDPVSGSIFLQAQQLESSRS